MCDVQIDLCPVFPTQHEEVDGKLRAFHDVQGQERSGVIPHQRQKVYAFISLYSWAAKQPSKRWLQAAPESMFFPVPNDIWS